MADTEQSARARDRSRPLYIVISQTYVPDPAAVGQYMHDAAVALAQSGCRVKVYTSARGYDDPTQRFAAHETRDGVEIVRLPLSSFGKQSIKLRLLAGFSFVIQAALRALLTRKLGGVLISTSPPMAPLAGSLLHLIRRTRVTYWLMDLNPDQMVRMGKLGANALPVRFFNAMQRSILKRAAAVVVLDRFMADLVKAKHDPGKRLHIMPPWPQDDDLQRVEHDDNPFRREHGLEGKFVVMYSGNHTPVNPLDTLIEAAKCFGPDDDIVFLFVGGGGDKPRIDQVINDINQPHIRSLPYQPKQTLRYSLSAADLHVVTVGDSVVGVVHPCKIYGALAVGRPVLTIGPEPCHASEIIAGKDVGVHIQHGDIDGCENAIRSIAAMDHAARSATGQQASRLATEVADPARLKADLTRLIAK